MSPALRCRYFPVPDTFLRTPHGNCSEHVQLRSGNKTTDLGTGTGSDTKMPRLLWSRPRIRRGTRRPSRPQQRRRLRPRACSGLSQPFRRASRCGRKPSGVTTAFHKAVSFHLWPKFSQTVCETSFRCTRSATRGWIHWGAVLYCTLNSHVFGIDLWSCCFRRSSVRRPVIANRTKVRLPISRDGGRLAGAERPPPPSLRSLHRTIPVRLPFTQPQSGVDREEHRLRPRSHRGVSPTGHKGATCPAICMVSGEAPSSFFAIQIFSRRGRGVTVSQYLLTTRLDARSAVPRSIVPARAG
jgi:hypothetical protein